jgi:hypothetical protein
VCVAHFLLWGLTEQPKFMWEFLGLTRGISGISGDGSPNSREDRFLQGSLPVKLDEDLIHFSLYNV